MLFGMVKFEDVAFYAVVGYVALMVWIFSKELRHWEKQRKAVKDE